MARIENLNLSQRVTNELGKAIIGGSYNASTGLPTEAQLCEEYGISRTAVREAVKMLAAKGLISSRPRQGIRVESASNWNLYDTSVLRWMLESSPSLLVLKEFLQMRMAIEPQAAALAARQGDKDAIAKINDALNTMRKAVNEQEGSLHEGDLAFHTAILFASGNRFFYQLREFITTALNVSIQHTTPAKGNKQTIVEEHEKVYAAIVAGEPERAKNMMAYLIDEAMTFIETEIAQSKSA
ncbi:MULTISPECIES: FadR/GntR family transcriptional regulator [unclassified Alteromonas]|uniref:FadR/GntR family transcriptional regulator n=1 Tax=unclassified Alteromonas TaxID=2614992 RepID=UPI000C5DEFA9|nr:MULTISPECIES: FadR/GntR family transcriptional regulator [unclassified Alteromonas]AYA66174.1 FadR family transcriptional regulator [Alteromonas sp. RKMC-009]MBT79632.1 FadR family transcriptional regulator [Alteromonadaceae bacterium]MDO6474144.1 FadR/GntR family transcriptional regulator [Alteromonas sp. 1_MG-2023]MEC7692451.1 FadR/GntR family transcriptional regulator [Pseudomonadota bacterium]